MDKSIYTLIVLFFHRDLQIIYGYMKACWKTLQIAFWFIKLRKFLRPWEHFQNIPKKHKGEFPWILFFLYKIRETWDSGRNRTAYQIWLRTEQDKNLASVKN